jgi:DNA invertase Pin-like site-specific DNA recombinase
VIDAAKTRSVTEPISADPVGKLTENILAAIAQFDNDAKAERTKVGMRAALERGRWTWKAPLGYRNGNVKVGESSLLPDVECAPMIARGLEMVASGYTKTGALNPSPVSRLRPAVQSWMAAARLHRPALSSGQLQHTFG